MAKAKSAGASALAAAQKLRGRDPSGVIANNVVERIVRNSSREFQDYLASSAGGNAMAAAQRAVAAAPPMPSFGGGGMDLIAPGHYVPEGQVVSPTTSPPMFPPIMPNAAMPQLGDPSQDNLRGDPSRRVVGPEVLMPDVGLRPEQALSAAMGYDDKTLPLRIYEDGSYSVDRGPGYEPTMADLFRNYQRENPSDAPAVNTSETNPLPVAPPSLSLVPQQPEVDPAMVRTLRFLGLI